MKGVGLFLVNLQMIGSQLTIFFAKKAQNDRGFRTPSKEGDQGVELFRLNLRGIWRSTDQILRKKPQNDKRC